MILLDEPAVNLHPPQMKALMDKLVATKSHILVATHSPKLVHNLIFDFNANLFYVRRTGAKSIATQLNAALHFEDEDRYKLSYQIDTRVFFANRIVMCEGEADREFLDIAARHYDMEIDTRENIIVDVGSNGNFGKYSRVLNNIGIPFTILADGDNHDDNTLRKLAAKYSDDGESYSIVRNDGIDDLTNQVFFFCKNLEDFYPKTRQFPIQGCFRVHKGKGGC